ncbi:MAG: diguanylate cyclase [Deltaproteobacteria bacterium]|nr:diguanylate cyclase [Deltaproteobacteria bacterium]
MSLAAPEEHTTHELLELVAAVLERTVGLAPREVPSVILDLAIEDGPFDFGALYIPGKTGALEYDRGRGFPAELRPTLIRGFGAKERIEECRRDGTALVLSSMDTEDDSSGGIEEALGAEAALLIPLLDTPEDCPVLLLASILHDVTGAGAGLCRSLQAVCQSARARAGEMQRGIDATRRWDRLVQSVPEPLLFADPKGTVVQANPAAAKLYGKTPAELEGLRVNDLLPGLSYRSEEWTGFAKAISGKERVKVITAILPKDDSGNALYLHAVHLMAPPRAEPSLDASGSLDTSTGLPGREAFHLEVLREIGLAQKYHGFCSVLVVDLDGLSGVRQAIGDEVVAVLRGIGEALQGRLRRSDRLGRLGGDSFGVLLSRSSREQAMGVANSLLAIVRLTSKKMGYALSASIGISYFPDDGEDAESLLETAFGAMMLAKRGGGDSVLVWTPRLMAGRQNASSSRKRTRPTPKQAAPAQESSHSRRPLSATSQERVAASATTSQRSATTSQRSEATAKASSRSPMSATATAKARNTPTSPILPAPGSGGFPRVGVEVIEAGPDPDEEETDFIDEVLDMNNLVIALPEDPSAEVDGY